MKLSKKLLKSKIISEIICTLAYSYIKFVYFTSNWQIFGKEYIEELKCLDKGAIVIFWHGRLLMVPPFAIKQKNFHVLISRHNDGQLITNVIEKFGFKTVRGSTGKRGVKAVKDSLNILKNNDVLAITPDGPKGPKEVISGNVVDIASKAKTPIFAITYSVSRCKILNSWDNFILPKPFSKGCFICSKPLYLDGNENIDEKLVILEKLQKTLNDISNEADRIVGLKGKN